MHPTATLEKNVDWGGAAGHVKSNIYDLANRDPDELLQGVRAVLLQLVQPIPQLSLLLFGVALELTHIRRRRAAGLR